MEENENKNVVNPNPQENGNVGPKNETTKQPKKKKMGAGKGILIALVIVLCVLIIALLLRMVIAGDGDYFKPFKDMFGIKTEEKEKEKAPNVVKNDNGFESAERYTLLSDDTNDEDVSHYRLTIDVGDIVAKVAEQMKTVSEEEEGKTNNSYSSEVFENSDTYKEYGEEGYAPLLNNYDEDEEEEDEDTTVDNSLVYSTYDDEEDTENEVDNETENEYASDTETATDIINSFADVAESYEDYLDGEIYFDIYFEGNDLVQAVVGFDYGPIVDNLYNYLQDHPEEADGVDFDTPDDLADYLVDTFDEYLTEDAIYDAIVSDDKDFESEMSQYGITEKDIKDVVDIVNEKGLIEVYINGTSKVKDLISKGLDSNDFKDWIDELEDETGVTIDKDNVFESTIEAFNDYVENSDDYKDYGIEFTEID